MEGAMKVLMSGSSGFIGSALNLELARRGHDVVRLVRSDPRPGSTSIRWDPDHGELDARQVEGFDAVVNLAGEGIGSRRWNASHKQRILESRTRSTGLLVETLTRLEDPPRVLLNASGIGFYGDGGERELTEESPAGKGYLAEVVRAWEGATQPAEAAGIRVVRVRSAIVLSPQGGALKPQLLLFRLGLGGRLGSGRQWFSWISVDDETGAIAYLLESDQAQGPYNLAAPTPVTNLEFTKTLGRVLGRPTFFAVPERVLRAVLGGEMAENLLLVSQRAVPAKLLQTGYRFRYPDLQSALRSMLGTTRT